MTPYIGMLVEMVSANNFVIFYHLFFVTLSVYKKKIQKKGIHSIICNLMFYSTHILEHVLY